jgi:hypothetical protein
MNETSSAPRRVVHLTIECAIQKDGTPMWSAGHPEEVVARADPSWRSSAQWRRPPTLPR